jgi:hypothetical protein
MLATLESRGTSCFLVKLGVYVGTGFGPVPTFV